MTFVSELQPEDSVDGAVNSLNLNNSVNFITTRMNTDNNTAVVKVLVQEILRLKKRELKAARKAEEEEERAEQAARKAKDY